MRFRHVLICLIFEGVYAAAAGAIIAGKAVPTNHIDPDNTWIPLGLLVAGIGASGLFAWNVRGVMEDLKNRTERNKRVIDNHIIECGKNDAEMKAISSQVQELTGKVDTLISRSR